MTIQELISLFSRYRKRFNDIEITQMCGLGKGTTTTKIKTTNPIVYFLYNQELQKVATDNISLTACPEQAVSSFCYYLVSININGTVTTTKGVDNIYALPSTPAGQVAIGAMLITTDSVTTFTAGTTDLNWVAVNFYDIDCGMALFFINQAQSNLERGVTITRKNKQRTVMNFDHMMVRVLAALSENDSSVILPFPRFKCFVDEGLNIYDSTGLTTRLHKEDILPLGITSIKTRPKIISQIITAETVFAPDGYPGTTFYLWPTCDQSYTLDIQAYQYSPDLDGIIYSNNWLTDNAADILLFGALSQSSLYFGNDSQAKDWEANYQEAVWTLFTAQSQEKYSGSHIGTNFPNPLRRRAMGLYSQGDINSGIIY